MNTNQKKMFHICKLILLALLLLQGFPYASVKADDTHSGGKHNGDVAVDPINSEDGYSAVLYNNLNGLPTSEANDIVETSDGFIWIGSYSGLIRYDGSTFERIPSSTGITSVKCLYVDSKDRLWVGTNDNGVFMIVKGQMRKWNRQDGLSSPAIRSIIEDSDGTIYVATTEGLAAIDQDLNLSIVDDRRVKETFLYELRKASDDTIYCLTNSGEVFTIENGQIGKYYDFKGTPIEGISALLPDPKDPDLFYIEGKDGMVYHCSLSADFQIQIPINIYPLSQVQVFEYFDDKIWICSRNGIGTLEDDGFHLLDDVPMNNSIGHMMSDYAGNLWFTSTRQGVMKIVPNRFTDIFERYGLENTVVNSTCMYDGKLFIATDNGLIVLDEEGIVEEIPLHKAVTASASALPYLDLIQMMDGVRIRSLIKDSRNNLWLSTWRSHGLVRYRDGGLTSYNTEDGLFSNMIRTVVEGKDGSILVAGTGGVNVIRNGRISSSFSEIDGVINTEILTLLEGRNGEIIIGTDGGGIYIIHDATVSHIGLDEGLSSSVVMRIKYDEKRDVYWLVTGNSLSYMDAWYHVKTIENFPYSNIFDLYESDNDQMWVITSNGIYVANADDLLNKENFATVHYGRSNGLPCIATANSYSELTEDGDLYIAGSTGVGKVNIDEPFDSVSDLKVTLPYLEADGVRIYPDESGRYIVPSNTQRLTILPHIFTYSLIEPTVSYRLEGFDKEYTTITSKELAASYYTNLKGGTYQYKMEISDPIGQSTKAFNVTIIKEKAFYEQVWFYLLTLALLALILYSTLTSYMNRRLKAVELKHKEQAEKQRIASELSTAAAIQQSMLPHVFPDRKEFEVYASMDPAKEVGGDFYDCFLVDEDHLCLVIADVSGKGIPGSLFMMISKLIIQSCTQLSASPAEILTKANETICANNKAQMFVTVWVGILEISTGKLVAANAGHEYPIIKETGNDFEILRDKHGLVIGAMEGIRYTQYELDLKPGSKFFLYTDGIPEATDKDNKLFGMDRLLQALNSSPDESPRQLSLNVRQAVDKFVSKAEQFDDLTMMCIEYKGKKKE
ncbi:MAG: SpoIIE family protein phosphatase [Erysipelotrichaceae bacterium]|nr:SpoIIE family protein phosphatase [Erysipelotrichaceae bacterium]